LHRVDGIHVTGAMSEDEDDNNHISVEKQAPSNSKHSKTSQQRETTSRIEKRASKRQRSEAKSMLRVEEQVEKELGLLDLSKQDLWRELQSYGWHYQKNPDKLHHNDHVYVRPEVEKGLRLQGYQLDVHYFQEMDDVYDFVKKNSIDGVNCVGALSEDLLQVSRQADDDNSSEDSSASDHDGTEALLALPLDQIIGRLRLHGWQVTKKGHETRYYRPGVNLDDDDAMSNEDYFTSKVNVKEFIEQWRIDLDERFGAINEEAYGNDEQKQDQMTNDFRQKNNSRQQFKSAERKVVEEDDEEEEEALWEKPSDVIWKTLHGAEWDWKKGSGNITYRWFRPNAPKIRQGAVLNEHYFESFDDVVNYIRRHNIDGYVRTGRCEDLNTENHTFEGDQVRQKETETQPQQTLVVPTLVQESIAPEQNISQSLATRVQAVNRETDSPPQSRLPTLVQESVAPEQNNSQSLATPVQDINQESDSSPQSGLASTVRNFIVGSLSNSLSNLFSQKRKKTSGDAMTEKEPNYDQEGKTQVQSSASQNDDEAPIEPHFDHDAISRNQQTLLLLDETQIDSTIDLDAALQLQQTLDQNEEDDAPPLTQAREPFQDEANSDQDAESDQEDEVAQEEENDLNQDLHLPAFDFDDDNEEAYYQSTKELDDEIQATFGDDDDIENGDDEQVVHQGNIEMRCDADMHVQRSQSDGITESPVSLHPLSQESSADRSAPGEVPNDDSYNQWATYAGIQINRGGTGSVLKSGKRGLSKRKRADISQTAVPTMTQDLLGADDDDLQEVGLVEQSTAAPRREGESLNEESKEDTVTARTFDKYYKGFGHLYYHVLRHMGWTHRTSSRLDARGTVYLAPGVTDETNAVLGVDYFPNSNAVEAKVRLDPNVVLKLKEVKGLADEDDEDEEENSNSRRRPSKRHAVDPSCLESGEWSVSCVSDEAREQRDASEVARRRAFGDVAPRASAYIIAESGKTKAACKRYRAALEESTDRANRGAAKKRRSADARRERENAEIQAAEDRADRLDNLILPVTEEALASTVGERTSSGLDAIFTEHHMEKDFETWRAQLMQGWSLLLQGFGSKRHLLEAFAHDCLAECGQVAVIDGAKVDLDLRGELIELANILSLRLPPSSSAAYLCDKGTALGVARRLVAAVEKKGTVRSDSESGNLANLATTIPSNRDTFASLSRRLTPLRPGDVLFVVVHSIDGPRLRNKMALNALAALRSKRVHLIASSDHINTAILWDPPVVKAFNWIPVDATTFAWYDTEAPLPLLATTSNNKAKGPVVNTTGLEHVLKSLTDRHIQALEKIAKGQREADSRRSVAPFKAMTYQELLRIARSEFIAATDIMLRDNLRELKDHNLIQSKQHLGIEYVYMAQQYIQPILTYAAKRLKK